MELVNLGVLSYHEAKDVQEQLKRDNIELILNHNETTCKRGCTVTVELHAYEKDIPKVLEVLQKGYQKIYEGLDIDQNLLNQTFDPSQSEATCPACGHKFSTSLNECPDCGLCF